MRIPSSASPDVQSAFRELDSEVSSLKSQFVLLNGAKLTGAGDANTASGLVTLRQLNNELIGVDRKLQDIRDTIELMKKENNLK